MMTRTAAGLAGLAALGLPESLWALQPGEDAVTFTDYTDAFRILASESRPRVRCVDLRNLADWTTPNDEHYTFSQTSTPVVDPATYRLRIGGFVERPVELTLDQLKARRDRRDEAVTLECSGNSTRPNRMCGLLSNGVWTGVGLKSLLEECRVTPDAREVLFLGLDMEREKKFQAGNREYRGAARPGHPPARRAAPRHDAGVRAERAADSARSGLSCAAARARLVRDDAGEVARPD